MNSRIRSVDVLRGFAVAMMVLCNNPGNTDRNYIQLRHMPWGGLTFADFAFPFFIIVMGITIPVVIEKRLALKVGMAAIISKVFIRSIILILLGLFLNGFPIFDFHSMRIPSVLARLGIVYLFASIVFLIVKKSFKDDRYVIGSLIIISFIIILGYYFLIKPYGFNIEGNLEQKIDSYYLSGHLAYITWDPEGIISTIPSIATGLLGCIMGCLLNYKNINDYYKVAGMIALSIVGFIGASLFSRVIPYNKMIWTSSFVLITGAVAALSLALLYLVCDIYKKEGLLKPFIFLGSSPIFVYLVSELIRKTIWRIPIYDAQFKEPLLFCRWVTLRFVTPWAGQWLDSLYFSILYVMLWMWISSKLYAKDKIIKI